MDEIFKELNTNLDNRLFNWKANTYTKLRKIGMSSVNDLLIGLYLGKHNFGKKDIINIKENLKKIGICLNDEQIAMPLLHMESKKVITLKKRIYDFFRKINIDITELEVGNKFVFIQYQMNFSRTKMNMRIKESDFNSIKKRIIQNIITEIDYQIEEQIMLKKQLMSETEVVIGDIKNE